MQITIKVSSPKQVLDEIAAWLRRAAQAERAFAETLGGKRRVQEANRAATLLEKHADIIAEMNVEITPDGE